jgi:hypothetical protein
VKNVGFIENLIHSRRRKQKENPAHFAGLEDKEKFLHEFCIGYF